MAYLIDSSVAIDLERRRIPIAELRVQFGGSDMAIATITLSELLVGVHRASIPARRDRRRSTLDRLLQDVTVLPFDAEIARRHAQLSADLAATGSIVGARDLIIAATAIVHDLTLLTLDLRHCPRIPMLRLLDRSTDKAPTHMGDLSCTTVP